MLAPGKRPFHTIIPAFMEKGDLHIGFGIMGGPNQPLAHAQFVSNIVDFGMNIQQALESPRFTKTSANGCDVSIESRVPPSTIKQLKDARSPGSSTPGIHPGDGTRPGHSAQFENRNQLRRIRSPGRWTSDPRANPVLG